MMVSPDELGITEFLHENTLFLVQSQAQDLVENGITGQDLQKELERFNQHLPEPLDTDDLRAIFERYDPAIINKKRIEAAIASKDGKELNKCIHYLAAVKRRNALQYGIIESMVKDSFGKSINLQYFKTTVNAEVRRQ